MRKSLPLFICPAMVCYTLVALGKFCCGDTPRVLDDRYELTLVAESPAIVTPIGMTFDAAGRLLVIESHTHFRPADYDGPPADRVRIFEDSDGDGTLDRWSTFWEGTKASMSLARQPDGNIFLATRNEVLQLLDNDRDGIADAQQRVAWLDTPGDYPHNGLSGLCFTQDGRLVFGLGENLGVDYRLIGSDGTTLVGGGEGGNIYVCQPDGSQLERLATGFWNPFGICQDPAGRLFAVGNDPDARPPCRLVHVVPGGDYGYQFRYGRSGKHPLQAWDGELPGTLPMVAGTGEAPSSVVPYHGDLWVTSWGDHQIERYRLVPEGASWRATNDVVVVGNENFRPVGFAVAPDGSLYFSDWVDRSYDLHRRGRIWRLQRRATTVDRPATDDTATGQFPPLTPDERRAAQARRQADWEAAASHDPFLWQAAVWGIYRHAKEGSLEQLDALADARQRLALISAARWKFPSDKRWVDRALSDPDPDVRLAAVRWIADLDWTEFRSRVLAQLDWEAGNESLYRAAAAAVAWLDHRKPEPNQELLVSLAIEPTRSAALRAWALRLLGPDVNVSREQWATLLNDPTRTVQREAVWALVQSGFADRNALLTTVVRDHARDASVRADALIGITRHAASHPDLMTQLASVELPDPMRRVATRTADDWKPVDRDERPDNTDVMAWLERSQATDLPEPDAEAGRRIFFQDQAGRCYQCHRWHGQGNDVGPDLTEIGKRMTRRRVIESLLIPHREVAPQYKAFVLETEDGEVLTGMTLGQFDGGAKERFMATDGTAFEVDLSRVVARDMIGNSIMPEGLIDRLSSQDLRDLLEFLGN